MSTLVCEKVPDVRAGRCCPARGDALHSRIACEVSGRRSFLRGIVHSESFGSLRMRSKVSSSIDWISGTRKRSLSDSHAEIIEAGFAGERRVIRSVFGDAKSGILAQLLHVHVYSFLELQRVPESRRALVHFAAKSRDLSIVRLQSLEGLFPCPVAGIERCQIPGVPQGHLGSKRMLRVAASASV